MPLFHVTHYTTTTEVYAVEAPTGDEALDLVASGEYDGDPIDGDEGCEPSGYFWEPAEEVLEVSRTQDSDNDLNTETDHDDNF